MAKQSQLGLQILDFSSKFNFSMFTTEVLDRYKVYKRFCRFSIVDPFGKVRCVIFKNCSSPWCLNACMRVAAHVGGAHTPNNFYLGSAVGNKKNATLSPFTVFCGTLWDQQGLSCTQAADEMYRYILHAVPFQGYDEFVQESNANHAMRVEVSVDGETTSVDPFTHIDKMEEAAEEEAAEEEADEGEEEEAEEADVGPEGSEEAEEEEEEQEDDEAEEEREDGGDEEDRTCKGIKLLMVAKYTSMCSLHLSKVCKHSNTLGLSVCILY